MKSGVSGGVTAVVNRELGIDLWSPRLDKLGNSPRAVTACRALSDELGLHTDDPSNSGSTIFGAFLADGRVPNGPSPLISAARSRPAGTATERPRHRCGVAALTGNRPRVSRRSRHRSALRQGPSVVA